MKRYLFAALALAAVALPAQAKDIVEEWASIKTPAAPTLKPVTADPKTTALLMLDFMNQNCGKRPRCVATIPAMKDLLAKARAAKATVIYSIIANSTTADVIKDVAPQADEPHVLSGPDKFLNTDLDKVLKEKGNIGALVLGAARESGPGPLVSHFASVAGTLPCPVIVVPATLGDSKLTA